MPTNPLTRRRFDPVDRERISISERSFWLGAAFATAVNLLVAWWVNAGGAP